MSNIITRALTATSVAAALAIGLGMAPNASATDLGDYVCTLFDQGASSTQVAAKVKEQVGMQGEYADFNATILAQQLAAQNCPKYAAEFGSI